jgi:RHS repeat-associated protein
VGCFILFGAQLIPTGIIAWHVRHQRRPTGTVTNRYVHGTNAAADDPLVWYAGSTLGTVHYLHPDHEGSIVAVTDGTGAKYAINTYDEYGTPVFSGSQSINTGRFQYTGQAWLNELNLYYYKARFYSPGLGRFLQTDPIGYDGGLNLYEYVGDDPVDANDPTGLEGDCDTGSRIPGASAACKIAGGIKDAVENAARLQDEPLTALLATLRMPLETP